MKKPVSIETVEFRDSFVGYVGIVHVAQGRSMSKFFPVFSPVRREERVVF